MFPCFLCHWCIRSACEEANTDAADTRFFKVHDVAVTALPDQNVSHWRGFYCSSCSSWNPLCKLSVVRLHRGHRPVTILCVSVCASWGWTVSSGAPGGLVWFCQPAPTEVGRQHQAISLSCSPSLVGWWSPHWDGSTGTSPRWPGMVLPSNPTPHLLSSPTK